LGYHTFLPHLDFLQVAENRVSCGGSKSVTFVDESLGEDDLLKPLALVEVKLSPEPWSVNQHGSREGQNRLDVEILDVCFVQLQLLLVGGPLGIGHSIAEGAKRYVDVLQGDAGAFRNGGTYTSPPKKNVGPLTLADYPHLQDERHQDIAWRVIGELTGVSIDGEAVVA
jgi:hypothetical protein